MADAVHGAILDAVVRCVERDGLAGFSVASVASSAGVSRATVYRRFPGGRQELVRAAVTREVERFWRKLAEAVAQEPTLEDRLVRGLMTADTMLRGHDLLQRLLASEPDEFLPVLVGSEPIVHLVLREYLVSLLQQERLRADVDRAEAADYLARMLLTHIGSPGRWDMADETSVRRLVATQFMGGLRPTHG